MNIVEMYEKVKAIYEANEDKYYYIGLRFEDKEREIGEECEWSRHNPDREDEREFPAYGTEEYENLEVLDGTSAWYMGDFDDNRPILPGFGSLRNADLTKEANRFFLFEHCYVIAGNQKGHHDDPDDGEILIKDAVVIAKIF